MVWSIQIPWLRWPGLPRRPRPARRPAGAAAADAWRRDPLSHPALLAMSRRQLDDLPIDPRALAEE